MHLCFSDANDKDVTNNKKKNKDGKTEIIIHDDPSDKHKGSVHVEEVVHNDPRDSLIFSNEV